MGGILRLADPSSRDELARELTERHSESWSSHEFPTTCRQCELKMNELDKAGRVSADIMLPYRLVVDPAWLTYENIYHKVTQAKEPTVSSITSDQRLRREIMSYEVEYLNTKQGLVTRGGLLNELPPEDRLAMLRTLLDPHAALWWTRHGGMIAACLEHRGAYVGEPTSGIQAYWANPAASLEWFKSALNDSGRYHHRFRQAVAEAVGKTKKKAGSLQDSHLAQASLGILDEQVKLLTAPMVKQGGNPYDPILRNLTNPWLFTSANTYYRSPQSSGPRNWDEYFQLCRPDITVNFGRPGKDVRGLFDTVKEGDHIYFPDAGESQWTSYIPGRPTSPRIPGCRALRLALIENAREDWPKAGVKLDKAYVYERVYRKATSTGGRKPSPVSPVGEGHFGILPLFLIDLDLGQFTE